MKKLSSKRGESLVETLVSVLIIAFSMVLLTTSIRVAVKFSEQADAIEENYRLQWNNAEQKRPSAGIKKVRIDGIYYTVSISAEPDEGICSYWKN